MTKYDFGKAREHSEESRAYLEDGWEPFAVTVEDEIEHSYDKYGIATARVSGHHNPIWFRIERK